MGLRNHVLDGGQDWTNSFIAGTVQDCDAPSCHIYYGHLLLVWWVAGCVAQW